MNSQSLRYAALAGIFLTIGISTQTECISPVVAAIAQFSWQNAKAFARYAPMKAAQNIIFGPFGTIAGLCIGLKTSQLLGLDVMGYLYENFTRSRLAGNYKKELIKEPRDLVGSIMQRDEVQATIRSINNATLQHPAPSTLLWGPPGYGKTELAYRIAYETKCPLMYVACGGVNQMGTGAQTIQSIFTAATSQSWYSQVKNRIAGYFGRQQTQKPTIILLDEIDSIADRQMAYGDRATTLNKLLTLLNHIPGEDPQAKNFVIIATTNRQPTDLYDSLMRGGRIGTHINITEPTKADRIEILQHYATKFNCQPNINWQELSEQAEHFSGAHLKSIFETAAARDDNNMITQDNMALVINGMRPDILARIERDQREALRNNNAMRFGGLDNFNF